MLKRTITYTDFNGKQVTDPFAFHLSPADLLEMEANTPGGIEAQLKRIQDTNDGAEVWEFFKKLITKSIGEVSSDGKRFVRNDEIRSNFLDSNAFSALLLELVQNADTAATFFNAIMPEGLDSIDVPPTDPQRGRHVAEAQPVVGPGPRTITKAEAEEMDDQELLAKVKDGWQIQT